MLDTSLVPDLSWISGYPSMRWDISLTCCYAAFVGKCQVRRPGDDRDPSWKAPCFIEIAAQAGVHYPIGDSVDRSRHHSFAIDFSSRCTNTRVFRMSLDCCWL